MPQWEAPSGGGGSTDDTASSGGDGSAASGTPEPTPTPTEPSHGDSTSGSGSTSPTTEPDHSFTEGSTTTVDVDAGAVSGYGADDFDPADVRQAQTGDSGGRLDRAAGWYRDNISDPVGQMTADATPFVHAEERALGTTRSRRFTGSAASAIAELGNIPAHISGVRSVGDAYAGTQQNVGVGQFQPTVGVTRPGALEEQAESVREGGGEVVAGAVANPFAAAGTIFGAVGGGLGAPAAARSASRAGQFGRGSASGSSGSGGGITARLDVEDFFGDTRAQSGLGRQRRGRDDDGPQSELNIDMDELDDLLGNFERAERSRRIQSRVEQRELRRNREAARRQDPQPRQGLDDSNRFDPDRSAVSDGNRFDPDRSAVSQRGSFDTTRSGPRSQQQQRMVDWTRSQDFGSSGPTASGTSTGTTGSASASGASGTSTGSATASGTGVFGGAESAAATGLGGLSAVNDPTGIGDFGGLTGDGTGTGSEFAIGSDETALGLGGLDQDAVENLGLDSERSASPFAGVAGLGEVAGVNDPTQIAAPGAGIGTGTGTGADAGIDSDTDIGAGSREDTAAGTDTPTATATGTTPTTRRVTTVDPTGGGGPRGGSPIGDPTTATDISTTGTPGGGGPPGPRPVPLPRGDLDPDRDDEDPVFDTEADDDIFGSGILGGEDAWEQAFGDSR